MPKSLSHLNGIERVTRQDKQGLPVLAAEEYIYGALWSMDDADLLSRWTVDEYLPCRDIHIARCVADYTLAALVGK